MQKTILILLFLTSVFICKGQNAPYINYTVEDGLPSNETYAVFQDKDGYIWIGTDRGVCRFTGYNFEVFSTNDGLPDNAIFNFYQDYKGRIWFFTFNGKIGFYYRGTFQTLDIEVGKKHIIGIFVTEKDEVNVDYYDTHRTVAAFSLQNDTLQKNSVKIRTLFSNELLKTIVIRGNEPMEARFEYAKDEMRSIVNHMFRNQKRNKAIKVGDTILGTVHDDSTFALIDSNMVFFKKIRLTKEEGTINDVGMTGQYWFIVSNKGYVLKYTLDKSSILIKKQHFPAFSPSYILVDQFGGEWITTLNKGVLYFPNTSIKQKEIPAELVGKQLRHYARNDKVEVISIYEGQILTYPVEGGKAISTIDYLSNTQNINTNANEFQIGCGPNGVLLNSDGTIGQALYRVRQWPNDSSKSVLPRYKAYFDVIKTKMDKYLSCHGSCVFIEEEMYCDERAVRMTKLVEQGDTIWIATMKGLFAFSYEKRDFIDFNRDSLLSRRISDLVVIGGNKLAMTTMDSGILLKFGDNVHQITRSDGLINNTTSHIVSDGKRTLWVSGNKGLSKITFESFDPLEYSIVNLGPADGLFFKDIGSMQLYEDSLYLLSENSLSVLNKNYEFNKTTPQLYLEGLSVNGRDTNWNQQLDLRYDQNNLEISFYALYYPDPNSITYYYSIDGGFTWQINRSKSVTFLNLARGEYSFVVKAVTPKGIESEIQRMQFTINPPWWLTWWAFCIYTLLLILAVSLIFRIRLRRTREKERIKHKMVEMELKALRSQMNPHFTFNTMNSIQHFINSNDGEEANNYISKFSRLMRKILDNSREEFITIEEELEALELYLQIESLRFMGKFDYTITVDEEIDEAFERIPPLVIQPFAENAIWHGLMQKDGVRLLSIKLSRYDQDDILCVIEDNGIGRKKAEANKSMFRTSQKSHGMTITQTRLELLNSMNKRKLESKIIDLYDDDGKAAGTRVEIYIPTK